MVPIGVEYILLVFNGLKVNHKGIGFLFSPISCLYFSSTSHLIHCFPPMLLTQLTGLTVNSSLRHCIASAGRPYPRAVILGFDEVVSECFLFACGLQEITSYLEVKID